MSSNLESPGENDTVGNPNWKQHVPRRLFWKSASFVIADAINGMR